MFRKGTEPFSFCSFVQIFPTACQFVFPLKIVISSESFPNEYICESNTDLGHRIEEYTNEENRDV